MSDYLLGVTGVLDNLGDVENQKSITSAAYADTLAKYDAAIQKQGLVDTVIESTTPAIIATLAPTAVKFLASTYRSTFGLPKAGSTAPDGESSADAAPSADVAPEANVAPEVNVAPEADIAPVADVSVPLPTGTFGPVEDEIAEFAEPLVEAAAPVIEGAGGIISSTLASATEIGTGIVSLGSTLASSTAGIISSVPGAVASGLDVGTDIAATTGSVGQAIAGGVEAASTGLDLTGVGAIVGVVLGAGALIYSLVETFLPHHSPKPPPVPQVAELEAQPQTRL